MALVPTRELEEAALRGGPAPWWWKNKEGAPWCSLCRRFITKEHVGSDRHVAKVDWEEWLALARFPDPVQPDTIQLAQLPDRKPLALDLALDQGCLAAHEPADPCVAYVVDGVNSAHGRIRSPDRDPGGNWIKEWSETHGRHYFWNDLDPQLVFCKIQDYSVEYHQV